MRRVTLNLSVAALFLLEGTVAQVLMPTDWRKEFWLVPHLTLVAIISISLYLGRREGLYYGMVFGGIYDLVYGDVLGLGLFGYGLVAYTLGFLVQIFHRNIWLVLTAAGMGSLFLDGLEYGFYRLFQLTSADATFVFYHEIIPSSLMNMLLAFLMYPVFHPMLMSLEAAKHDQGEGGHSWKK